MAGNPSFDLFKLAEEHDELRAAIRGLAEKEIAPYAKDVDEKARFPQEALDALVASGFNAVHVPEEYDGQGADSVAACIVIEEVARVCASSSLIPAVNKLGTMGLILSGSDELKKQVLPSIASGEAMASYALSEREAGSDAASMRTRAKADGDDWIINGSKCWITNGGKSSWYTVMAVTDPEKKAHGISAFMVHKDDEGFTVGPLEHKLGIKGSPTAELYFENCRIPGDRIIGRMTPADASHHSSTGGFFSKSNMNSGNEGLSRIAKGFDRPAGQRPSASAVSSRAISGRSGLSNRRVSPVAGCSNPRMAACSACPASASSALRASSPRRPSRRSCSCCGRSPAA